METDTVPRVSPLAGGSGPLPVLPGITVLRVAAAPGHADGDGGEAHLDEHCLPVPRVATAPGHADGEGRVEEGGAAHLDEPHLPAVLGQLQIQKVPTRASGENSAS